MAEEKKTPAKAEESKLAKILNWFKKLPGRIAKPFKNMVAELKKVTWPSKKKWISSSIMVLVFMLFMGVVIGLLDLGAVASLRPGPPLSLRLLLRLPRLMRPTLPLLTQRRLPWPTPRKRLLRLKLPRLSPRKLRLLSNQLPV